MTYLRLAVLLSIGTAGWVHRHPTKHLTETVSIPLRRGHAASPIPYPLPRQGRSATATPRGPARYTPELPQAPAPTSPPSSALTATTALQLLASAAEAIGGEDRTADLPEGLLASSLACSAPATASAIPSFAAASSSSRPPPSLCLRSLEARCKPFVGPRSPGLLL